MKYFAAIVAGLVTLLGFSSFCPAQTDVNLIDTPTASVLKKTATTSTSGFTKREESLFRERLD